ncbi:MAG: 50S ribosomal protein L24 [Candidatus Magasanikbacteria bacterium RIFOXYC12_FULL_33_11]|uniref:Large ribosomal subunit protein uL24 n=1 Tax=Candidatus Magasanikbacteria bacterium RIFOXYC12_FULL_33_11 TaxID=1798701 RepID=A0A1F6NSB1_9BACT|nr:MAG: 50S ribosomal protein L24 [Candidatus Magasanikbacteria bacterium RIFOXYC12_FULL_33_11]
MKIKTGDKVKVLSGKDRGKTGKILQVLTNKTTNRVFVVVEGANLLKKHLRAGKQGEKGQIIELPAPMDISNVMLIDGNSKKPTRVGYKIEGDKKKRVAKVSGEFID